MTFPLRAALLAGAALLMARSACAAPLTLGQAVERAIAASPDIRASGAGIDAARAEQTQAHVRPNPTLSVEAENFAGTGSYMQDVYPRAVKTLERADRRRAHRRRDQAVRR